MTGVIAVHVRGGVSGVPRPLKAEPASELSAEERFPAAGGDPPRAGTEPLARRLISCAVRGGRGSRRHRASRPA
jgi:hypothetical protein